MVRGRVSVEVDERLRAAAVEGDVEFLRECVASKKPDEYYLTVFPKRHDEDVYYGNIFHLAAWSQQEQFIRAAAVDEDKLLGPEVIQQLLCQSQCKDNKANPLHLAPVKGNVEIVKMFINAFNSSSSSSSSSSSTSSSADEGVPTPPWLLTDAGNDTPCHRALFVGAEECGLQMLKMDLDSLSNMVNADGFSLLYLALCRGLFKAAAHIIISAHCFSSSGPNGLHALHIVSQSLPIDKGELLFRWLLEKKPELITKSSISGESVFHYWARDGIKWPFRCLLYTVKDGRRKFVDLISKTDDKGMNALHMLSKAENPYYWEVVEIGKLLIDTYRNTQPISLSSSSFSTKRQLFPWLVKDVQGNTPLDCAIAQGHDELATMILSNDKNTLTYASKNVLFISFENRLYQVLLKILEIVDQNKKLTDLLINQDNLTALHLAPKANEEFLQQLLKGHPYLVGRVDKSGNTILHHWSKLGQEWPFVYLFSSKKKSPQLMSLLMHKHHMEESFFHVAVSCTYPEIHKVLQLIVDAFKENVNYKIHDIMQRCGSNINGEGPLHLAIRCQQDQRIALYLLSLYEHDRMEELLDLYTPEKHKILFLAIQKNFSEVVKMILGRLDKESWNKYVKDFSNGQNILHVASSCTDKELGKWLVEEAPELITEPDITGITPVHQASDIGASWIIEAMFEKDGLAFRKSPLAWVKACEKGHVSVIRTFIEYCPEMFSDHCFEYNDSPLHHIKIQNIVRYEEFINMRYMKDLINLQDSTKATPLHKAIENGNILLAEVLLNMDNINYNIKNEEGKTARYLLAQLYKEDRKWELMCRRIRFDPNIKTSYFQRKTDLLEARHTLSLVAALLATITFTAGFTLPGGFDQNNGEAMLADKAAFLVFLISDTLAMCFSMLVLICLIWSMVFEPNRIHYF